MVTAIGGDFLLSMIQVDVVSVAWKEFFLYGSRGRGHGWVMSGGIVFTFTIQLRRDLPYSGRRLSDNMFRFPVDTRKTRRKLEMCDITISRKYREAAAAAATTIRIKIKHVMEAKLPDVKHTIPVLHYTR